MPARRQWVSRVSYADIHFLYPTRSATRQRSLRLPSKSCTKLYQCPQQPMAYAARPGKHPHFLFHTRWAQYGSNPLTMRNQATFLPEPVISTRSDHLSTAPAWVEIGIPTTSTKRISGAQLQGVPWRPAWFSAQVCRSACPVSPPVWPGASNTPGHQSGQKGPAYT